MIIESILNLLYRVITLVFGILPNIPSFEGFENSVDTVFNVIFNNVDLLSCFIRPTSIQLVIPLLIIIINFDKIYKLAMFIIRKIPMLNIN